MHASRSFGNLHITLLYYSYGDFLLKITKQDYTPYEASLGGLQVTSVTSLRVIVCIVSSKTISKVQIARFTCCSN